MKTEDFQVCVVGHPFAPIGMGELLRRIYRALSIVGLSPLVLDVYELNPPETLGESYLSGSLTRQLSPINIFVINGDEVDQCLSHIKDRNFTKSYNIIYPAWELSNYPEAWAQKLEIFDEIWAFSTFLQRSIQASAKKPCYYLPLSCETKLYNFLGRRYFNIPESCYVFLFFFDLKSYFDRKNPQSVIKVFKRLLDHSSSSNAHLVLKISGGGLHKEKLDEIYSSLVEVSGRVTIIDKILTDNEVKNLIRCCDCFISLHRSEGFGLAIAEAMWLAKPVIATNYSGNTDFMSEDTSYPVPFKLIPVECGQYPYWEGQVWAYPDENHAFSVMLKLIERPELGREVGRKASSFLQSHFSSRNTGLLYLRRLLDVSF